MDVSGKSYMPNMLAAAAALCIASSAGAATTITWNFATPTGPLQGSQDYVGLITSGPALPNNPDLTLIASGYESQKQGTKTTQISGDNLYGETLGGTVSGLGLDQATLPYPLPAGVATSNEIFTYAAKIAKVKTTFLGFVQLDLTALIDLAAQSGTPKSATITIAGLQGTDKAKISDSANPGIAGTGIKTIAAPGSGGTSTTAFPLTDFTSKRHFLTITAATGDVLLNQITLTIPSAAAAAPTPAPFNVVLGGAAVMGLIRLARRRASRGQGWHHL
jgi:hypothetical protein